MRCCRPSRKPWSSLIGATTENPFFEVNSALLSRCQLYRFEALGSELVEELVRRALKDAERGLGALPLELEQGADALLAELSGGDARVALNALETAVLALGAKPGGEVRVVTLASLKDAAQKSPVIYDREDAHYDTISAFIKSLRGSDADAAIYYLATMLEGGEDPKFIARRMIVFASEDVGNADPQRPARGRRRLACRRVRGPAGVPHQSQPGSCLSVAGAQEQRRLHGHRRGGGRGAAAWQPCATAPSAQL